jgi:hypothetical protein
MFAAEHLCLNLSRQNYPSPLDPHNSKNTKHVSYFEFHALYLHYLASSSVILFITVGILIGNPRCMRAPPLKYGEYRSQ